MAEEARSPQERRQKSREAKGEVVVRSPSPVANRRCAGPLQQLTIGLTPCLAVSRAVAERPGLSLVPIFGILDFLAGVVVRGANGVIEGGKACAIQRASG